MKPWMVVVVLLEAVWIGVGQHAVASLVLPRLGSGVASAAILLTSLALFVAASVSANSRLHDFLTRARENR